MKQREDNFNPSFKTLSGHYINSNYSQDNLQRAVFSPDVEYIATVGNNGTAKLWHVESGELINTITAGEKVGSGYRGISDLTFSPDGKCIITIDSGGTAKLWHVESGELIKTYLVAPTSSITYSPNGKNIITSDPKDGTAKLWDSESGEVVNTFIGHDKYMCHANFSPDSKYIITRDAALKAKLWDSESGKLIKTLTTHGEYTFEAKFSPDSKSIVTVGDKNQIAKIWDVGSAALLKVFTLDQYEAMTTIANFSPDSKYVITGGSLTNRQNDGVGQVLLWNIESSQLVNSFYHLTNTLTNAVFSPDGKYFMTNGLTVKLTHKTLIWSAESQKIVISLSENITHELNQKSPVSIAGFKSTFSPDGKYVVTGAPGNTAKLWALDDTIETPFENKKKDHELYKPQDMEQENCLQKYGAKNSLDKDNTLRDDATRAVLSEEIDRNPEINKITLFQKIREEINSIKSLFKYKVEKQIVLQEACFLKEENVECISEHFNDTISEILGNIDIEYDYV